MKKKIKINKMNAAEVRFLDALNKKELAINMEASKRVIKRLHAKEYEEFMKFANIAVKACEQGLL